MKGRDSLPQTHWSAKIGGETWIPYDQAQTENKGQVVDEVSLPQSTGGDIEGDQPGLKPMMFAAGAGLAFLLSGSRRLINNPTLIIFLSLPWLPIINETLRRLNTSASLAGPGTGSRTFMRFVVYPLAGILTFFPAGVFALNAYHLRLPHLAGYAVFGMLPALFCIGTVLSWRKVISRTPSWIFWTTSFSASISIVGVIFMAAFLIGTLLGLVVG